VRTDRFDQEDGLDVEDMRVQTLERMRRIFVLVLMAALFVYHVAHVWPPHMVLWLRRLGGTPLAWAFPPIWMAHTSCWQASARPSLQPPRSPLLHNIPSPEPEELVGNHQV